MSELMEASDEILLQRTASRDRQAFGAFYDRHSARVFGILLRMLRDRREAEDALQDVFWHVWERAAQYDSNRGNPEIWLLMIARSRALDRLRKLARDASRPVTPVGESDPAAPRDDYAIDTREQAGRARNALAQLPPEQRQAIELAFFEGLSHTTIAEREGISLGTIKTRIRLGMRKLRELLTMEAGAA
ncbi:MAG: sigma-70 family RNA polymerase sigma factor [Phycisphaerae bacterium]